LQKQIVKKDAPCIHPIASPAQFAINLVGIKGRLLHISKLLMQIWNVIASD